MSDPILDFMAITGCPDEALAIDILSSCDFDIGAAVASYTSTMSDATAAPSAPVPPVVSPPSSSPPPPAPGRFDAGDYAADDDVSTLVDRLGSDFNPGVQLGMAPANPFAAGSNQTLVSMFSHPEYVIRQTSSLETVCTRSRQVDRWVLLAFVDKEFPSVCLPRDLWRAPQMMELGENYVACLEVSVTTGYGERLAHDYRVLGSVFPRLFIVNPLTSSRAAEIVIEAAHIEAQSVVSQILTFIADNGSPSAYAAALGQSDGDDDDEHTAPLPHVETTTGDIDDATSTRNTASPLHEPDTMPGSPSELTDVPVDTSSADVVVVEPVSLESYTSEAPGAFRLRVRLPLSALTLQLRPETPVTEVIRYVAYSIHSAAPETHPVPPSVEIRCGFPPADVTVSDPSIPVSAWPGVRSGDNVMVRIK